MPLATHTCQNPQEQDMSISNPLIYSMKSRRIQQSSPCTSHPNRAPSSTTKPTMSNSQPNVSNPIEYRIHSTNEINTAAPITLSRASKDITFGSISGMLAKFFEHPFDLVKVRLQTQPSDKPPRYRGAWDCFKQTYQGEGFRGLYRGISMPVLGATAENACLFFTYNYVQSLIRSATGQHLPTGLDSSREAEAASPLSMGALSIAAAAAGAATSLVLTPIELVKCRMQVQMISQEIQLAELSTSSIASSTSKSNLNSATLRSFSTSSTMKKGTSEISKDAFKKLDGPVQIVRQTLKNEGFSGLWLGQTGTLLRETGGGIAWFLAFEGVCRSMIEREKKLSGDESKGKKDLNSLQLVAAGAAAGISYNVILFPADCVKSTMQTEEEMRAKPKAGAARLPRTGFFTTFKNIYNSRGLKGLYAGCGVTCLRSAPSSALIFLLYNKLESAADSYGV